MIVKTVKLDGPYVVTRFKFMGILIYKKIARKGFH